MRRAPRCTVEAVVHRAGKFRSLKGELPGLSVLLRNRDDVFHTYSTYQRGLDLLLNTYNYLDLTPLGRRRTVNPRRVGSVTTTATAGS